MSGRPGQIAELQRSDSVRWRWIDWLDRVWQGPLVRGLLSATATAASVLALAIYAPFRAIPIKAIRERAELASLDAQLVERLRRPAGPARRSGPGRDRPRAAGRGRSVGFAIASCDEVVADRAFRRRDRQLFDAPRRGLPGPRGEQAHHAWPGTLPRLAPGTDDRSVRRGQSDPRRPRCGTTRPPLGRLLGVLRSRAGRPAEGGRQLPARWRSRPSSPGCPRPRSRSRAGR